MDKKTTLIDINGREIEIGMQVKTQQQPGGILPPAEATIGTTVRAIEVKGYENSIWTESDIFIEYPKKYNGKDIKCYIYINHAINEIVLQ